MAKLTCCLLLLATVVFVHAQPNLFSFFGQNKQRLGDILEDKSFLGFLWLGWLASIQRWRIGGACLSLTFSSAQSAPAEASSRNEGGSNAAVSSSNNADSASSGSRGGSNDYQWSGYSYFGQEKRLLGDAMNGEEEVPATDSPKPSGPAAESRKSKTKEISDETPPTETAVIPPPPAPLATDPPKPKKKLSPEERIQKCCKASRKINPECRNRCSYDIVQVNSIAADYLKGICTKEALLAILECVSQQVDHRPCCKRAGVSEYCSMFCFSEKTELSASPKILDCGDYASEITTCFKRYDKNNPTYVEMS